MEFKIGNIKPKNKIVLAPMAGITNQAYRTICKEMGAGLVYAEMVSDKGIAFKNEKTKKMVEIDNSEHPIAMQIFGSDYKTITASAIEMVKLSDFDILSKTGAKLVEIEAYGDLVNNEVKYGNNAWYVNADGKDWFIVGGVSTTILIGCAVISLLILRKKKGGVNNEKN